MNNAKKQMYAVIGANYGDEGKGLMVDYLASSSSNPIVIRFNGGAQAGHTVQTPDGKRHVFSHFGSGTFVKAPTFLSKFFICNPYMFVKELRELMITPYDMPIVYIDPGSIVSTPFDMLYNQILELSRQENYRHGSVGLGINETLKRTYKPIRASDLLGSIDLKQQLKDIHQYYVKKLQSIIPNSSSKGLSNEAKYLYSVFTLGGDVIIENFLLDCKTVTDFTKITIPNFDNYDTIIFEGGQGLLLDEEYGEMPYCTPTSCGMKNVQILINSLELFECSLDVIYMTRWYMTRHGAGPLENEEPLPSWVIDETNKPHTFQGTLRYAPIEDMQKLIGRISTDVLTHSLHLTSTPLRYRLGVTCLDQGNPPQEFLQSELIDYMSFGPTRETMKKRER